MIATCARHLRINRQALSKSLAERLSLKAVLAVYGLTTLLMTISVIYEVEF
ncbi:MAG: hypothetical protein LBP33_04110 [Candidatus Adiutrix sp.]|nr:hypothetical protein [Candidatus Adiutrix sp.]